MPSASSRRDESNGTSRECRRRWSAADELDLESSGNGPRRRRRSAGDQIQRVAETRGVEGVLCAGCEGVGCRGDADRARADGEKTGELVAGDAAHSAPRKRWE